MTPAACLEKAGHQRIETIDIYFTGLPPVQYFDLADNAAAIVIHISFNRFPWLNLLRGVTRVKATEMIPIPMAFLLCAGAS